MKNKTGLLLLVTLSLLATQTRAQDIVSDHYLPGSFPIISRTMGATAIYLAPGDHWLVTKTTSLLQADIEKITGIRPTILTSLPASPGAIQNLIIIGSLDHSPLIRQLARQKTFPAEKLTGKWEAFLWKSIPNPVSWAKHTLLIAGSDRRGTAYGILELSRQIGISPWYWWADVPVKHQSEIYLDCHTWDQQHPSGYDLPAVKYRGFFINDEAPALSGWAKKKFGGLNHEFYEKVFELLLRLKANYLWPAMWGNAFNDDDTLNPILADRYGIVMGTSHHEPMLRAQQEWKRYGKGPWDYKTNAPTLDSFWRTGIRNMDHHESIVTVGMRGDGDMPMEESSNIALLEKIVDDQRKIISEVTGKTPAATPQSWALYKEVQDYYDKGMRVPDDVTLLLCDDNWGNVRKLPAPGAKPRTGGYGIYYHFDYVGDPRNYKWLNTNPIPRVWQQMHLAYQYGVDHIWIVNVGDIKPLEFPIQFFLDYAWSPDRLPADSLQAYTQQWAARQFGPQHAGIIASILTDYTRYNGRCKPELLSPNTYSLLHYQEAETITADYNRLADIADSIYQLIPAACKDAYYQLILYPVLACANLNELYVTVGRNRLYAAQGRTITNDLAAKAQRLFANDSILSSYYNKQMAGGKWDHMMDQTHIGYTYWQQPPVNAIPELQTLDGSARNALPSGNTGTNPAWGIAIEGSASWWPKDSGQAILPTFDPLRRQPHYIEVFNRGTDPFEYSIQTTSPWITASPSTGRIDKQERIWINIDWTKAPSGRQRTPITITGPAGRQVTLIVITDNPSISLPSTQREFIETDGYVSIEAEHFDNASPQWQRIPGLGRTLSAMESKPLTAPAQSPGGNSSRLEYAIQLFDTGTINVHAFLSPHLPFNDKPLHYAISFDDETPQIMDITTGVDKGAGWGKMVADNIRIIISRHHITAPGRHVLKFWMVDPGVVLQKLVIDAGGMKPSYLGPPESYYIGGSLATTTIDTTGTAKGLKDYYQNYFPIGVAVSPRSLSGPDTTLILRQFNSLTPENAMKMGPIHPQQDHYNWKDADLIVNFAQAHGLRVRGHNLCWHEQTPAWFFTDSLGRQVSKEILLQRLKDHIMTVVGRYKGKIYAWDVVNEAIDDDSAHLLRNSPWYKICGDDFITKAFEYAHQADPDAQLFYNDYNTERPEKRERVYTLLKQLKAAGVPITGVGLQAHWSIYEPSAAQLQQTIERFSSLGLNVQITELDVSIYPWEKNKRPKRPNESDDLTPDLASKQADQYNKIFSILRANKLKVSGVTFWNLTDKHSWLDEYPVPGRKNYPLLFNTSGQPKKAYLDVVNF